MNSYCYDCGHPASMCQCNQFKTEVKGEFVLPSPYHRRYDLTKEDCQRGFVVLDCYALIELIGDMSPQQQHAFKKLAFLGKRGHKNAIKDIEECKWSLDEERKRIERAEQIKNEINQRAND